MFNVAHENRSVLAAKNASVVFAAVVSACIMFSYFDVRVFLFLTENLSSDSGVSSPSALNSPGVGIEGLNRRRKKRTSIETNIRVALEKSFLEVSEVFTSACLWGRG